MFLILGPSHVSPLISIAPPSLPRLSPRILLGSSFPSPCMCPNASHSGSIICTSPDAYYSSFPASILLASYSHHHFHFFSFPSRMHLPAFLLYVHISPLPSISISQCSPGLADYSDVDGMPYTTLLYTNGPGYRGEVDGVRPDPTLEDYST